MSDNPIMTRTHSTETPALPSDDSQDTVQALREQTQTLKQDVKDLGRLSRQASQEKLQEAREVAGQYIEKSKEKVSDIEDSVVSYVREKPIKSLLMATTAGAMLGFVLSRR